MEDGKATGNSFLSFRIKQTQVCLMRNDKNYLLLYNRRNSRLLTEDPTCGFVAMTLSK